MRHFDKTFWREILMKHFDITFWWDLLMTHFNEIFLYCILYTVSVLGRDKGLYLTVYATVWEWRCSDDWEEKDDRLNKLIDQLGQTMPSQTSDIGKKDSISPSKLNFSCHKGLTWDIYSPYTPWATLEVSSEMKPKWVCWRGCLHKLWQSGQNLP